ncbi:hypothetical protein [Streptomyces cinnamoneus]|uniref:Uncharacterized protein n=1 Tax=Streptomyces cinnamoneus TaxID=53446 RepID=A0A918WJ60_STRCJ|nr:hypothetical protein [Streptomyces cinnamoneus]GHC56551.1 hypothetical protein GCM10010507_36480 [Streptomyces cinnamoneus]
MSRTPAPLSPAAVTATAEPRRDDHVTARRLLRAAAIAARVPCLALKAAWPAGSRTGRRAGPPRVPLLLSGVGSAAPGRRGGRLPAAGPARRAATPPAPITYAVPVIIGLLVLASGTHPFHRRSTP